MNRIVCAVRGGPDSQATIAQAITLAQQTDLPLHFLHVVNRDFLSHISSNRIHTILAQMHQMGEFILSAAQDSATQQGITAQGAVRHGNVREEIINLCHELPAEYLVLGQPDVQRHVNVFTQVLLTKFIARTEKETGAKAVLSKG